MEWQKIVNIFVNWTINIFEDFGWTFVYTFQVICGFLCEYNTNKYHSNEQGFLLSKLASWLGNLLLFDILLALDKSREEFNFRRVW